MVELGHDAMQVAAVHEGVTFPQTDLKQPHAGRAVVQVFRHELRKEGVRLYDVNDSTNLLQDMVRNMCYCAYDFDAECDLPVEQIKKMYFLPNDTAIKVGRAVFKSPRSLV